MKEKIYLNILGFKNFETKSLIELCEEIEKLKPTYSSILYEPINELNNKIRTQLRKRETSKKVWVEFTAIWSGYSNPASSGQRREVGQFYRQFNRDIANKLPSYYSYPFSDGTTNDWNIKIVDKRGNNTGSYSSQVSEIINSLTTNL